LIYSINKKSNDIEHLNNRPKLVSFLQAIGARLINPVDSTLLLLGKFAIYKSTDNGKLWRPYPQDINYTVPSNYCLSINSKGKAIINFEPHSSDAPSEIKITNNYSNFNKKKGKRSPFGSRHLSLGLNDSNMYITHSFYVDLKNIAFSHFVKYNSEQVLDSAFLIRDHSFGNILTYNNTLISIAVYENDYDTITQRFLTRYYKIMKSEDKGFNWTTLDTINTRFTSNEIKIENDILKIKMFTNYECYLEYDLISNTKKYIYPKHEKLNNIIFHKLGNNIITLGDQHVYKLNSNYELYSKEHISKYIRNWKEHINFNNPYPNEMYLNQYTIHKDTSIYVINYKFLTQESINSFLGSLSNMFRSDVYKLTPKSTTSIESPQIEESAYLYTYPPRPNPATQSVSAEVYWNSAYTLSESNVSVYDIYGSKYNSNITFTSKEPFRAIINADCTNLATGIYFIRISVNGEHKTIPFTVVK
jgi:hypothetical protein